MFGLFKFAESVFAGIRKGITQHNSKVYTGRARISRAILFTNRQKQFNGTAVITRR